VAKVENSVRVFRPSRFNGNVRVGRGARKLMGENLKLVWSKFSTIS